MKAWIALLLLAGCGNSSSTPQVDANRRDASSIVDSRPLDAGIPDAAISTLTVTSTAWLEGALIPGMYTCKGTNVSPPLAWTAPSAAHQGYALVMTDKTNGLIHSVLWDIPATTLTLPENIQKVAMPAVPAGAKQPLAYDNQTYGYLGPCPPTEHMYAFAIYAVDALPLPGVTAQSNRTMLQAAINAHATAVGRLTGKFSIPPPL